MKNKKLWYWIGINIILLVLILIATLTLTSKNPTQEPTTPTITPTITTSSEPEELKQTLLQEKNPNAPTVDNRERTVTLEKNTATDGENMLTFNTIQLEKTTDCHIINANDYCLVAYNENDNISLFYFNDIINTRIFDNDTFKETRIQGALYAAQSTITSSDNEKKDVLLTVNKDSSGWVLTSNHNSDILQEVKENIKSN